MSVLGASAALILAFGAAGAHPAGATTVDCIGSDEAFIFSYNSSYGETTRVTFASRGPWIGFRQTGTDRFGSSIQGDFTCNYPEPGSRTLTVHLGDGNDAGRTNGSGSFGGYEGFRPVRKRIALTLDGGSGNDAITGHRGDGVLIGGAGADRIRDRGGTDVLRGGAGDDRIDARDGRLDVIYCGGGSDRVESDSQDELRGC